MIWYRASGRKGTSSELKQANANNPPATKECRLDEQGTITITVNQHHSSIDAHYHNREGGSVLNECPIKELSTCEGSSDPSLGKQLLAVQQEENVSVMFIDSNI